MIQWLALNEYKIGYMWIKIQDRLRLLFRENYLSFFLPLYTSENDKTIRLCPCLGINPGFYPKVILVIKGKRKKTEREREIHHTSCDNVKYMMYTRIQLTIFTHVIKPYKGSEDYLKCSVALVVMSWTRLTENNRTIKKDDGFPDHWESFDLAWPFRDFVMVQLHIHYKITYSSDIDKCSH